jgi:hypothetical protein
MNSRNSLEKVCQESPWADEEEVTHDEKNNALQVTGAFGNAWVEVDTIECAAVEFDVSAFNRAELRIHFDANVASGEDPDATDDEASDDDDGVRRLAKAALAGYIQCLPGYFVLHLPTVAVSPVLVAALAKHLAAKGRPMDDGDDEDALFAKCAEVAQNMSLAEARAKLDELQTAYRARIDKVNAKYRRPVTISASAAASSAASSPQSSAASSMQTPPPAKRKAGPYLAMVAPPEKQHAAVVMAELVVVPPPPPPSNLFVVLTRLSNLHVLHDESVSALREGCRLIGESTLGEKHELVMRIAEACGRVDGIHIGDAIYPCTHNANDDTSDAVKRMPKAHALLFVKEMNACGRMTENRRTPELRTMCKSIGLASSGTRATLLFNLSRVATF